jgi:hypothetical protein
VGAVSLPDVASALPRVRAVLASVSASK